MNPSLIIGGIPFYDAPSKIEGSPYWVDLWTDVKGYKIGLQVKPSSCKSASASLYMGRSRSSEERRHKEFLRDFGWKVFTINPINGSVSIDVERKVLAEYDRLLNMP